MLKKDGPIFLQNINMIACQLFLLFKKSTTFWDNPRTRAQRRVFKRKLFAVTNLAPGSLSDFIYKELTLDGAAAAHPITQERLRLKRCIELRYYRFNYYNAHDSGNITT